jgi:flagellin
MASVINTNMASLNAQRNLSSSQASLSTALQRLSSGLRINSAKDDSAGMAIASRMTSQINGLNQAARNANDGISLTKTAEGGLATASDLLQRMRELAVQSANSTNSDVDRASLQSEVSQLRDEIDRVAKSTNFNGISLLDGSFSAQVFQVGANNTSADRVQVNAIANIKANNLGSGMSGSASLTSGLMNTALTAGDLTLNGVQVGSAVAGAGAGQTADSAWATAQAINAVGARTGVTAKANATVATEIAVAGVAPTATTVDVAANSFAINGVSIGAIKFGTTFDGTTTPPTAGGPSDDIAQGANVAEAINKVTSQTGVRASVDDTGAVTLTSMTGNDIKIEVLGSYTAANLLSDAGLVGDTVANGGVITTTTNGPTAGAYTADSMRINGFSVGAIADGGTVQGQGANVAAAINLISGKTGVTATANAITGAITMTAADGRDIVLADGVNGDGDLVTLTGIDAATTVGDLNLNGDGTFTGSVTLSSSNVNGIVVGGANDTYAGLHAYEGQVAADQTATSNTLSAIDVGTSNGALSALSTIDAALAQINSARADMGAYQNRFSSVVSNLQSTAENLTAARSRIQDADFAAETAAMTRNQILQQAGIAILAQANAQSNSVLSLLK